MQFVLVAFIISIYLFYFLMLTYLLTLCHLVQKIGVLIIN